MATLYSRIWPHHYCLFRPQESHVFQNGSETEQKTGPMVPISIRIRRQTYPPPWHQNDPIRCLISTARSWPGCRTRQRLTPRSFIFKPLGLEYAGTNTDLQNNGFKYRKNPTDFIG